MSAWLCNEEHMYEMAHYYVANCQTYVAKKLDVEEVVTVLWDANIDSLMCRYGDDTEEASLSRKVLSHYRPIVKNIHHMAKLVDCFDYQSCESNVWKESKAKEMCDAILSNLLTANQDYEDAPWGFEPSEYKAIILDKVEAS